MQVAGRHTSHENAGEPLDRRVSNGPLVVCATAVPDIAKINIDQKTNNASLRLMKESPFWFLVVVSVSAPI
jgi:hypothetical protein